MIAIQSRSGRLEELLNFTAAYRGWTARQLAAALDRDPSNLVPDSGIPKLDLMLRLANTLEWHVADLVELLGHELGMSTDSPGPIERLDSSTCSRSSGHANPTRSKKAPIPLHPLNPHNPHTLPGPLAPSRRWREEIEVLQGRLLGAAASDGADESADPPNPAMVMLRLAQAYYNRGEPVEGRAIAGELLSSIAWVATPDAASLRVRGLVLRAACARELIESMHARGGDRRPPESEALPEGGRSLARAFDMSGMSGMIGINGVAMMARSALDDLNEASLQLGHPAAAERLSSPDALRHRAHTLRRELEEVLDPTRGREALLGVLADLDAVIDVDAFADLELLECHGWSCIGGFSLADRHLSGTARQQALGILSNKADEIASRVDSWSLRERVLTLEYARRRQLASIGGGEPEHEWLLDRDDLRAVVGCIGNSRRFRRIGLDILRHATIVDCEPLDLARRPRAARSPTSSSMKAAPSKPPRRDARTTVGA